MYKRFLPIFAVVMILITAGFSCKGTQGQQTAVTPVTLEFWTVYDDVDAIQSLVQKYKAQRPFLTINVRQLRIDEFYTRLIEALAEDKGPDIISIKNKWIPGYLSKLSPMPATAQDITATVEQTAIGVGEKTVINTQTITLPTPAQVQKEYVQAVYNDAVTGDKVYGLPLSMDLMAIYYNKDLLDKAGIPEAPKTWSEFQMAVKKLTKFDKKTGKIIQSGTALGTGNNIPGFEDLLFILLKQSGVDLIAKNGSAAFNIVRDQINPSMPVINFYTDFANSTRDTYSWNEEMENALDKFVNGSLAFFFGYNYHQKVIKSRAPQMNADVLPMFQLNPEKPVNAANYWMQVVLDKSKHKNEAWAFLNYLTHSKANKEYLDASGRPSALRAYIAGQNDNPDLYPFSSQDLIAESWYKGKNYEPTVKALGDMVHEWLLPVPENTNETQWKQQILNRAAAKVNQTL